MSEPHHVEEDSLKQIYPRIKPHLLAAYPDTHRKCGMERKRPNDHLCPPQASQPTMYVPIYLTTPPRADSKFLTHFTGKGGLSIFKWSTLCV